MVTERATLHILQLILVHPKVMSQFVHDRAADLLPDLGRLVGADHFNILRIRDALDGKNAVQYRATAKIYFNVEH